MVLLAVILFSTVIAWLRGGRLANLSKIPLHWGVLAVAAFAVQALFIYGAPAQPVVGGWGWPELVFSTAHLLLLFVAWRNRKLTGVAWVGAGLLLNWAAMLANGGWMPITPASLARAGHTDLAPSLAAGTRVYSSKNIVLPKDQTRLWLLSDIFVLAEPFPIPSVFSAGDVLVAVGVFLLIQDAMRAHHSAVPRVGSELRSEQ
jgi:hypothetical protein